MVVPPPYSGLLHCLGCPGCGGPGVGVGHESSVLWLVMSSSLPPQSSHRGHLQLRWVKNYLDFYLGLVIPPQALPEPETP